MLNSRVPENGLSLVRLLQVLLLFIRQCDVRRSFERSSNEGMEEGEYD